MELLDLKNKWAPILENRKTRKWVLKHLVLTGDRDTQIQARSLLDALYPKDPDPKLKKN